MSLRQTIRASLTVLQQSWTRMADSLFAATVPCPHDEMARGEFISAFICERELTFPMPRNQARH